MDPEIGCGDCAGEQPEQRESLMARLLRRKKRLHEQLAGCDAAIEALTEDPKLEALYTGLRAADHY